MRWKQVIREDILPDDPKGSAKRKGLARHLKDKREELRSVNDKGEPVYDPEYTKQHLDYDRKVFSRIGKHGTRYKRLRDERKKQVAQGHDVHVPDRFQWEKPDHEYEDLKPLKRNLDNAGILPQKYAPEPLNPNRTRVLTPTQKSQLHKDRLTHAIKKQDVTAPRLTPKMTGQIRDAVRGVKITPNQFGGLLAAELMSKYKVTKHPASIKTPSEIANFYAAQMGGEEVLKVVNMIVARHPSDKPRREKVAAVAQGRGRGRPKNSETDPAVLMLARKIRELRDGSGVKDMKKFLFMAQAGIHSQYGEKVKGHFLKPSDHPSTTRFIAMYRPLIGDAAILGAFQRVVAMSSAR